MARILIKNKEMTPKDLEELILSSIDLLEKLSSEDIVAEYPLLEAIIKDIISNFKIRNVLY